MAAEVKSRGFAILPGLFHMRGIVESLERESKGTCKKFPVAFRNVSLHQWLNFWLEKFPVELVLL